MDVVTNSYMPGDPRLIDQIVYELKSQGVFDQFRKDCISDVDTKPAYQNLRQRVEGSVTNFLNKQCWSPDINKNQLREQLRKTIYESGYLETGVERIVDQVVNPKINTVFLPKVEEIVYKFLGIEKPNKSDVQKSPEKRPIKIDVADLLPTDLEAISPESVNNDITMQGDDFKIEEMEKTKDESFNSFDNNDSSSKADDDESPPFEPLDEPISILAHQEEISVESNLSGFSGLASHDSNQGFSTSQPKLNSELNVDSQFSQNSSEGRLSIVTSDDNSKMEISEDSQEKEENVMHFEKIIEKVPLEENMDIDKNIDLTKNEDKKDVIKDISVKEELPKNEQNIEENKVEDIEFENKKIEDKKVEKKSRSSDKQKSSKRDRSKDKTEERDKDKKSSNKDKDKNKDNNKSTKDKEHRSSNKHSSSSTKDRKDSSSSRDKDKERRGKDKTGDKEKSEKPRDKDKADRDKDKSYKDKRDKDKDIKEKENREKHDKEKAEKSSKDKDRSDKDKGRDKDKKSKSSSTSSMSTSKKEPSSSNSSKKEVKEKDGDKSRSSSSNHSKDSKDKINKEKEKKSSSSDKHKRNDGKDRDKERHSVSSNNKYVSSSKKDKEKDRKSSKDDHYSSKDKKTERRSTDRDSNDGGSSKMSRNSSFTDNAGGHSSEKKSDKENSMNGGSNGNSSGNLDQKEAKNEENKETMMQVNNVEVFQKFKYIKPKFASNMKEALRLMKIRKELARLERQNQIVLAEVKANNINISQIEHKNEEIVHEDQTVPTPVPLENGCPIQKEENKIKIQNLIQEEERILQSTDLSSERWAELEAKLAHEMSLIDCKSYYGEEDDSFYDLEVYERERNTEKEEDKKNVGEVKNLIAEKEDTKSKEDLTKKKNKKSVTVVKNNVKDNKKEKDSETVKTLEEKQNFKHEHEAATKNKAKRRKMSESKAEVKAKSPNKKANTRVKGSLKGGIEVLKGTTRGDNTSPKKLKNGQKDDKVLYVHLEKLGKYYGKLPLDSVKIQENSAEILDENARGVVLENDSTDLMILDEDGKVEESMVIEETVVLDDHEICADDFDQNRLVIEDEENVLIPVENEVVLKEVNDQPDAMEEEVPVVLVEDADLVLSEEEIEEIKNLAVNNEDGAIVCELELAYDEKLLFKLKDEGKIVRGNGIIQDAESGKEGCRYLEKSTSEEETKLQTIYDFIGMLERNVEELSLKIHNNIPKVERKRKITDDTKNNNKACFNKAVKKPRLASINKEASLDELCNTTDILNNESFSFPLSPAESNKSIENKEKLTVPIKRKSMLSRAPKQTRQSYSSEDLYKPRPVFSVSSRRSRSAKNTEN